MLLISLGATPPTRTRTCAHTRAPVEKVWVGLPDDDIQVSSCLWYFLPGNKANESSLASKPSVVVEMMYSKSNAHVLFRGVLTPLWD